MADVFEGEAREDFNLKKVVELLKEQINLEIELSELLVH